MIQGLNLQNSKVAAGKGGAEALTNDLANALAANPELALEQADFANELESSMKMDELLMADLQLPASESKTATDAQPKSVLTPEALLSAPVVSLKGLENLNQELPSEMVKQLPSLQPDAEGVKAKLVDPSLTKDVRNLMDPKLSLKGEVLDLEGIPSSETEISSLKKDQIQTILAAPLLKGEASRSPAIDLSPAETDPELMKFDDFMLQRQMKNSKKVQGGEAYGLPKNTQVKELETLDLKSTQIIADSSSAQGATSAPSQEFILGLMSAESASKGLEVSNQSAAPKVFNMAQIKSGNTQEIMSQISDYIVQAKAAKEPTVQLKVNHQDFGQMDITVSRGMNAGHNNVENIAINIATSSPEVKAMLQQHKGELFSSLAQSGMNVTDFKVDSSNSKAGSDFNSNNGSNSNQFAGSEKQFGSEQNQRRHEQNRRADLWDLLKDKAAA
jgi:hypothetical protein